MSERLTREHRLRRRPDFLRCYRRGRRRHGALAILHYTPNELSHPRIGITASRKVGNSVVRHRLKRQIKEIYRRWEERDQVPSVDMVVHLKPAAARAGFEPLRQELIRLFRGTLARQDGARRPRGNRNTAVDSTGNGPAG